MKLKNVLIVFLILFALVVLIGAIGAYYFLPDGEKVLSFIRNNPKKSSILIVRNDTILANQNVNQIMPLASTVKIIIAVEYAEQVASNLLNPDEQVSLNELNKFYVANTDGGAHTEWIKSLGKKIVDSHVSIREVARGMIVYSSNANTEWLLNKLGAEKVNSRVDSLGMKNHTKIYNIVSALFVGKELFPDATGEPLRKRLQELSEEEYIAATNRIHGKLVSDTAYKKQTGDLSISIQKIWSDRLPASTVSDYVSLMKKMNSKTYFSEKCQQHLDEVMEYVMENPANREWLKHSGMKGGSTAFVLTTALYATDKKGNKTEMAYFLNDLSILEMMRLEMSMNEFELQVLTDPKFREKIKSEWVRIP